MLKFRLILATSVVVSFAACDVIDNDTERGVLGAAGGAVVASATGVNPVTGALIGGAAGVFCDDLNVCN